ncbi:hypothetical protein [Streptomyces sp. SS]|uniref:hypothetical protein n=1 Tax=Streptomyces sp. SS TaxID=260742 RepID=UPI000FFB45CF|nr:hypothetical protein [Streptomyces sp. SS]
MSDIQVDTFRSATGVSLTVAIPQSVLDQLADPKRTGSYKVPVTERPVPVGSDPVGIDQITINVFPDDAAEDGDQ